MGVALPKNRPKSKSAVNSRLGMHNDNVTVLTGTLAWPGSTRD